MHKVLTRLLAIAHEAEVELELEDFNRIADRVPHIADMKPGGRFHMIDLDRIGVAPGGSVRVTNGRGSITMTVQPSDDLLRGSAWVPFNHEGGPIAELLDCTAPVNDVRIETL